MTRHDNNEIQRAVKLKCPIYHDLVLNGKVSIMLSLAHSLCAMIGEFDTALFSDHSRSLTWYVTNKGQNR